MKVIIGSDHGGFELKEVLKQYVVSKGHEVDDQGTESEESCDYPDFAAKVAKKVQDTGQIGVLVCGTGIGVSMVANKFKGVRAALCHDEYTAKMSREHNDANIICVGGRTTDSELSKKMIDIFLNTEHSSEDRHKRRVNKISEIERNNFK